MECCSRALNSPALHLLSNTAMTICNMVNAARSRAAPRIVRLCSEHQNCLASRRNSTKKWRESGMGGSSSPG